MANLNKKELLFALNSIQELQRQNYGKSEISISTYHGTNDFAVTVNFNISELPSGSIQSEYDTAIFSEDMTHDDCVDKIDEIRKLIKKTYKNAREIS